MAVHFCPRIIYKAQLKSEIDPCSVISSVGLYVVIAYFYQSIVSRNFFGTLDVRDELIVARDAYSL